MKKKLWFIAAVFAVISFTFVSCGDNKDDPETTGGGDDFTLPSGAVELELLPHGEPAIHAKIPVSEFTAVPGGRKVRIYYEILVNALPKTGANYDPVIYISPSWSRVKDLWDDNIQKEIIPENPGSAKKGDVFSCDIDVQFLVDNQAIEEISNDPIATVIGVRHTNGSPHAKVSHAVLLAAE